MGIGRYHRNVLWIKGLVAFGGSIGDAWVTPLSLVGHYVSSILSLIVLWMVVDGTCFSIYRLVMM